MDVAFSTYMNYFNVKNSHWEPLIEPWDFKLELSRRSTRAQDPLHIRLVSDNELNINITHTFLESALATLRLWDKQRQVSLDYMACRSNSY